MAESPTMPVTGSVQESRFVGARWGKAIGRGNRLRSFSWSRELVFSSVAERMGFQVYLSGSYPVGLSGELIIEIEDGSTHGVLDFSIVSCDPTEIEVRPSSLLLTFEGMGGRDYIIDRAGLGGLGWEEIVTNWEDITTNWEESIPA